MNRYIIIFLVILIGLLLFFEVFLWRIEIELDKFERRLTTLESMAGEIYCINSINSSRSDIMKKINNDSLATTLLENSLKYNIDYDLLIKIITIESSWNSKAISPKGAIGLMQIMPETAEIYSSLFFEGKKFDLFNPKDNIILGTRILYDNIQIYREINLALACYNGGPKQVKLYAQNRACKETGNYINKILEEL